MIWNQKVILVYVWYEQAVSLGIDNDVSVTRMAVIVATFLIVVKRDPTTEAESFLELPILHFCTVPLVQIWGIS